MICKLSAHMLRNACAIDALRFYLDPREPLRPSFTELRLKVRKPQSRVEDYRPSLPIILLRPKPGWRRLAPLVLDVKGVGKLSAQEIASVISQVIATDPYKIRVGAVDCTADWRGGSISLCRRSLRVPSKRKFTQYVNHNRNEPLAHENGKVETLYFGSPRSESYVRIYDKTEERKRRKKEEKNTKRSKVGRRVNVGNRCRRVPRSWVRIERHITGRSLPKILRTLGGLLKYGGRYRPFDVIEVDANPRIGLIRFALWDATPNERRNAVYTQLLINHHGKAGAARILRCENRKASREFTTLKRAIEELKILSSPIPDFNELFQRAFRAQFFPASPCLKTKPKNCFSYNHLVGEGDLPRGFLEDFCGAASEASPLAEISSYVKGGGR